MIYKINLSDSANRDLRNIFEYIFYNLNAPQSASGILDKLENGILSLEEMPNRHKVIEREPWMSRKVRLMPVGNYVVIYHSDDNTATVNIMRILYGGRDIDAELNKLNK